MSDLYKLICSLSPSEKRHFKVYAQRSSTTKEAHYLQLFEAIEKIESDEEEELQRKFRKAPFLKNLAFHKNYLFDAILSALRSYNEPNFIDWQLRENVYRVKILMAKGLDKAAHKLLVKTKEQAWKYEEFTTLVDLVSIEKYLFSNNRIGSYDQETSSIIVEDNNKSIQYLEQVEYYRNVWQEIAVYQNSHKLLGKEQVMQAQQNIMAKVAAAPAPDESTPFSVQHYYHAAWHLFYSGDNFDVQKVYFHAKKLVEIHEKRMEAQPLMSLDPLARYYNVLLSGFYAEQWQDMEIYLEKLLNYDGCKTREQEIRKFHNYSWCALLYYLGIKDYPNAQKVVQYFREGIEKYGSIRPDFLVVIQSLCGVSAYFNDNFSEASQWWNQIIQQPKNNIELRIQCVVRIYKLLLYVKEKECEGLDSSILSVKRFISGANYLKEREALFFKYFPKCSGSENDKKTLQELLSKIKAVQEPFTETSVINKFVLDMLASMV